MSETPGSLALGPDARVLELEQQRDDALAAREAAEARVADLERERNEALAALEATQANAATVKQQRDKAWRSWQSEALELRNERERLARSLAGIHRQPWGPIKHSLSALALNALAGAVAPIHNPSSARLALSAENHSERYFESFLGGSRLSAEAKARRQGGRLNILYFTPFPSHPANHGNQWSIQQSGKRFQALGHKVHFALLESRMYDAEAERLMRQAWDSFQILPNTKQLWANGSEIPFDDWYEEGLGEEIRILCDIHDIDVVFCSYVFQSKLLEYIPEQILKVIDTHDKMSGRYEMLRANGQPPEFFSCSPEEEGAYLRRADIVVARREEEARYFDSVTGRHSAIVIPHVEEPLFVDRHFDRLENVGLVASANQINLSMALDFLETLARQGGAGRSFTVHIAGQVRDMVKGLSPRQAGVFDLPWVRMLGFVPDIGDFYRGMDAIVSPAMIGTGMNVKTIQAMAFGMPLVATSCGAKGIETEEPMHNHADMESLVQGLLQLARSPGELNRLAETSRSRYRKFYRDASRNMQAMLDQGKRI